MLQLQVAFFGPTYTQNNGEQTRRAFDNNRWSTEPNTPGANQLMYQIVVHTHNGAKHTPE